MRLGWLVALLLSLLLGGCTDQDTAYDGFLGGGGGGSSPQPPASGRLVYRVSGVPESVTALQFVAYDAHGVRVYGPVEREFSSTTRLPDVPSRAVALLTIFRTSSGGRVQGLDGNRFVLPPGETVTVDGRFRSLDTVVSLSVEPSEATLAVGGELPLRAMARLGSLSFEVTSVVDWTSAAPAVAEVSPRGVARGVAPGQAGVTASYGTLAATCRLTVTGQRLVRLQVEPPQAALTPGSQVQLRAWGFFEDGTSADVTTQVQWNSSAAGVAEVSDTEPTEGLTTALAAGSATVTARDPLTNLQSSSAVTVTGGGATTGGTTSGASTTGGTTGGSTTGGTGGTTTGGTTGGTTTGGSTTGTGTGGTGTGTGGTTGGTTGGVVTLVAIAVAPPVATVPSGRSLAFTATGIFSDNSTQDLTASATWSSSDPSTALVDAGLATGLKVGQVTVTATSQGLQGQARLTVTAATLTGLEIHPAQAIVPAGESLQLKGTGLYSDGTTQDLTAQLTWVSGQPDVASVADAPGTEGLVSAHKVGQATVTALDPGSDLSATSNLTVSAAQLQKVEVSPNPVLLPSLGARALKATGLYSDGSRRDITDAATWSSASPATAFVFNFRAVRGRVLGLLPGGTTVTATLKGQSGSTSVTVLGLVGFTLEVTPPTATIPVGREQAYQAALVTPGGLRLNVTSVATWSSSAPDLAAVDPGGLVHGVAPGSARIRAAFPRTALSGEATAIVTEPPPPILLIEPLNAEEPVGGEVQYRAYAQYSQGEQTVDVTREVTWSSSAAQVASISNAAGSEGLALLQRPGTTVIGAALDDVRATTNLTVTSAPLTSLQVLPANPALTVNETLQMTALATDSQNATHDLTRECVWSSSNPAVATVSTEPATAGSVAALAGGTTTITARDPASGLTAQTNVTVAAPPGPTRFSWAALVQTGRLDGGCFTDSFDSARGAYSPGSPGTQGSVATPSASPGSVRLLGGSCVKGTTFAGPGGKIGPAAPSQPTLNSDLVFWKDWNCFSLAETNLASVPSLPPVQVPSITGPDTDLTIGFAGGSPPPGRYRNVTVNGGGVMTLAAGTYVMSSLQVTGGGSIAVSSGNCTVYVTGSLSLTSASMGPSPPSRLALQLPSGATASLSQGVRAFMTFYAPQVDISLAGDAQIFGAAICRNLSLVGGSQIHYDEALGR